MAQTKICTKCGEEKEIECFYRRAKSPGGRRPNCKDCARLDENRRREKDPEKYRDKNRRWRDVNRERFNEMQRERRVHEREKRRARGALNNAVKRGRMVRPETCEDCGCVPERTIHAHHRDYSKPFDVEWLCDPCHKKRHHG